MLTVRFTLASSLDVFGALDVSPDGFGTHVAGRADIVRRRPKMPAPQGVPEQRIGGEKLARRGSLEDLYHLGDGDRRRERDEQMDVVGLGLD